MSDAAPTQALEAAWEACVAAWDDPKRHDALIQLVAAQGTYAWAAGRYRAIASERPEDAVAKKQLDRLSRAAMATMFASAAPRRDTQPKPYRATMTMLAMLVVAITVGLVYALVSKRGAGTTSGSEAGEPGDPPASIPATPAHPAH